MTTVRRAPTASRTPASKKKAPTRAIEKELAEQGRHMDDESLAALDAIWQQVKGVEKR